VEGISFVQFDDKDVVRHTLVQRIVKAYERYNDTIGASRQLTLKLAEAPVETATANGDGKAEAPAPAPDTAPQA
jgi:phosphate starvation-inducible PhoH-like protein